LEHRVPRRPEGTPVIAKPIAVRVSHAVISRRNPAAGGLFCLIMNRINSRHSTSICRTAWILLVTAFVGSACTNTDDAASVGSAKNVILIIGDGMDDQQITIARNYLVGSGGRLTLDDMTFRGAVQVQAVYEDRPNVPSYISDSANSATSVATGALTSPTRIGTTPQTDQDLVSILELAQDAGLRTGIVTTASLTDATPASFVAHINQRQCQGPRDMESYVERLRLRVDCSRDYKANGGRGSISEQLADSGVDVLLGGGSRYFDQPVEGGEDISVTDEAVSHGYRVIRSRDELLQLDDTGPVLGLFSNDTMPVRWRGKNGARATRIERVDGRPRLPEAFSCEPNPGFEGIPTLAEMTATALERLDNERGFLLVVESASIDKQSHERRPCGHIGELGQLDEALALALDYAKTHPQTMVLVTADHSHAAQLVAENGGNLFELGFATPGYFARVLTPEGSVMGINYATNDSPVIEYHTGSEVPLYASGPGVRELPIFMAQREIFLVMARHLGLDQAANSPQHD
jgi:alkaline phosphatase